MNQWGIYQPLSACIFCILYAHKRNVKLIIYIIHNNTKEATDSIVSNVRLTKRKSLTQQHANHHFSGSIGCVSSQKCEFICSKWPRWYYRFTCLYLLLWMPGYYVLFHRFHLHTMDKHDDLLPLIKFVEQSNRQVKWLYLWCTTLSFCKTSSSF